MVESVFDGNMSCVSFKNLFTFRVNISDDIVSMRRRAGNPNVAYDPFEQKTNEARKNKYYTTGFVVILLGLMLVFGVSMVPNVPVPKEVPRVPRVRRVPRVPSEEIKVRPPECDTETVVNVDSGWYLCFSDMLITKVHHITPEGGEYMYCKWDHTSTRVSKTITVSFEHVGPNGLLESSLVLSRKLHVCAWAFIGQTVGLLA